MPTELTLPQLDALAVLAEQRWDLIVSPGSTPPAYFWRRFEDGAIRYADSLTVRALVTRRLIRWRPPRRMWDAWEAVITIEGRRALRDSRHPAPPEPRFRPRIAGG